MKRRELLGLLAATAMVRGASAQRPPALIGWLHMSARELDGHNLAAFKEGLGVFGMREGAHYVVEDRWAEGRVARLRALAEDLARAKPQVSISFATQPIPALLKAMPTVPVVQVASADPVTTGFAKSLARPGGMVTGLANTVTDTTEKHPELLLAAAPGRRRIGFLADSTNFARVRFMEQATRSVAALGIEARFAEVGTPEEIDAAFASLAAQGVDALVVFPSPNFSHERRRIVRLGLERRWPMIAPRHEFAEDGALLAYGIDVVPQFRRAAYYVDRILKGAKAGDLPVEQPTTVELVINVRTAKALGLKVSPALLARAHRVIQ